MGLTAFFVICALLGFGSGSIGAVVLFGGLAVLLLGAGGSGRSGGSDPPCVQEPEPQPEPSAANRTGLYYRGSYAAWQPPLYSYRDGCIFKGVNYGVDLLNFYEYTYGNGVVRDRAGWVVGSYRDGHIWLGRCDVWYTDAAARYEKGYVYEGRYLPQMFTSGAIGCYTGDDAGGAACAIAALLADGR